MGIHSRDYIREEHEPSRFGGDGTSSVCTKIIVVTVVVFVLQILTAVSRPVDPADPFGQQYRTSQVDDWLALNVHSVAHGQIWRLVTYAFCHNAFEAFPLHIVLNMLFLWMFGKTLEAMMGGREFLLFYLAAAVVSGLAYLGLDLLLHTGASVVGASGAVMAVMMVFAMYFPRQQVYIFGILPVEVRWLVACYVIFEVFPVFKALAGIPTRDTVAHSAHLGGLAFGALYKMRQWRLSTFLQDWKLPRFGRLFGARRKIRIYKPQAAERDEDLDAKVDRVLEKISREGEASLTDREREILKTASQRYKNR
jgi:membrane associated rhomboid family serine protease